MNRLSAAVWVLAIVVASLMLYHVKYEVQGLRAQIVQTSRELEMEKESLHVVNAEWAYLNRPERLQQLAAKYLSASGMTVDRIAEIEAIPFPAQTTASAEPVAGIRPAAVTVDAKPELDGRE